MTADIVPFPKPDGNGSREALMDILRSPAAQCLGEWDAPAVTDYLLGKLFMAGFVIVPMEEKRGDDDPYVPNENTVRLSVEDWRKLNHGIDPLDHEQMK